MNTVKLVVNREEMTARFECEGNIWDWLKGAKIRNWNSANEVMQYVKDEEVKTFYYETPLNKFIRRFKDKIEIVEA